MLAYMRACRASSEAFRQLDGLPCWKRIFADIFHISQQARICIRMTYIWKQRKLLNAIKCEGGISVWTKLIYGSSKRKLMSCKISWAPFAKSGFNHLWHFSALKAAFIEQRLQAVGFPKIFKFWAHLEQIDELLLKVKFIVIWLLISLNSFTML
jgi:hypothetical protein